MRSLCFGLAAVLIAGAEDEGRANPLLECAVLTGEPAGVNECLRGQLEVSAGAMTEALALARASAEQIDRAAGGSVAVLGIEASQQAWEAYRDTSCETEAAFAASEASAEEAGLACEVALTRGRTDALLRLSGPRGE